GIHIYGVAVDDGHSMRDHCNGWVRVRAENSIASILEALKAGKFYSSCGPEIYDFYVDGDKAYIDCSAAAAIRIQSDMHPTRIVTSADGSMTHAEFGLNSWPGSYRYVRMTVIDKDGKFAWTNPIWLDE
ncbi:MAG: phosphotransferase, partial [Clostridia bacterium]|nr:phosphotransferase [Clostridia bacterium]